MERAAVVIQDILQEILVQAAEQSVNGIDSNTCIRYMNRFMDEMGAYGAALGYTKIKTPTDLVTIEPGGMNGLIFNTALRLANSYDIPVSGELSISARDGKKAMFRLSRSVGRTAMPSTLPIGSGNESENDYWRFYPGTENSIDTELDGSILLETDTNE